MKELTTQSEGKSTYNPFAGPEIERVMYTTEPQAEIWIACKIGDTEANRGYNESVTLILRGNLDHSAILKAIDSLVARHEALRSVFSTDGRFMTVFKQISIAVEEIEASNFNTAEIDKTLSNYLSAEANYVFDLVKGPLFKVGLIKVSETVHHLVLTAHHIICDGWSLGIMLEELGALYSANTLDISPSLPKAESFCDYADEQRIYLESAAHKKTETFWLNQFKDAIPELALPTDFPRPKLRTYKSERLDFSMGSDLVNALKKTGIKAGCSLVTTLLSAFEVFLHVQTGQEDIVLGLPSADQAASGKTQMIGHCVNLLPLRSKLDLDLSFTDYLKQRKSQLFDAYEHQQFSFGQLLQKLSIARDPSRVPLVPVVFNIDMGMSSAVSFLGLEYELKSNPRAYEPFEIFLNATGSEDDLVLEWSYNTSLFKRETIEKMMVSFLDLLRYVIASPNEKLQNAFKVDLSAYDSLNDTKINYPKLPLHQLIAQQSQTYAENQALKFGTTEITYKDLNKQINQLANCLAEQGVKPGAVIAVALPRSIELVISLLAIMQCGAAYLPLDPSYPKQRLDFMMKDSKAELLLSSKEVALNLESVPKLLYLEDLFLDLSNYASTPTQVSVEVEDMAYLLYTSGSTGNPKGVQITHKNLVNFLYGMLQSPGIKQTDRLLSITTISFDIAGLELFLPLLKGATLVIADDITAKDNRLMLDLIKEENISMLQATPTTWQMLLEVGWEKRLPIKALCGGEALSMGLANKLLEKVDELWNLYGPTETTIWSAVKQIKPNSDLITIGGPIANTQLYLLNEKGQLLEPGKIGELCIAGDGVAKGYWKRSDLTSEKFINNPFNKNGDHVLYKTGDLGKLLPSGEIQCLGRIDQQAKIRGHRIELGEIEEAINSLAKVEASVVLVNEDRLVAHVILAQNEEEVSQIEINQWKLYLAELLPNYMVPQEFYFLKDFPTTLNGKIDRKTLESKGAKTSTSKQEYTAPRTETETIVASIWEDCLKLEKVDIFSDFFELGGHSIIAVRVMSLIEKKTGLRLPLSALMIYPTVEKLAEHMGMDNKEMNWVSLVPIKPTGTKTPLYVIHGAGHNVLFFNSLARNLDEDQPIYGLQAKGLNGVDKPFDRIEDMAAHYISEIIKVNPEGPYAIAGYSVGGIIGFEMVKQLKAQGKTVKKLALFDSYVFPEYYYSDAFRRKLVTGLYNCGKVGFAINDMFSSTKNFKKRIKIGVKYVDHLFNKVTNGKDEEALIYKESIELDKLHHLAVAQYKIVPEDIEINLMVAEDDIYYKHDKKNFGWKSLALGGIHRHSIPGNHGTMFTAPNDKKVGRILQNILDN